MCSKFTSNIRPKWLLWVIIIFKNKWLINIYFSLSSLTKSKFLNKWMKEIKHAGISYISYVGYNTMHACMRYLFFSSLLLLILPSFSTILILLFKFQIQLLSVVVATVVEDNSAVPLLKSSLETTTCAWLFILLLMMALHR